MNDETVLLVEIAEDNLFQLLKEVFETENITFRSEAMVEGGAGWVISGKLQRYVRIFVHKKDYDRAQSLWKDIVQSVPIEGQ